MKIGMDGGAVYGDCHPGIFLIRNDQNTTLSKIMTLSLN